MDSIYHAEQNRKLKKTGVWLLIIGALLLFTGGIGIIPIIVAGFVFYSANTHAKLSERLLAQESLYGGSGSDAIRSYKNQPASHPAIYSVDTSQSDVATKLCASCRQSSHKPGAICSFCGCVV